VRVVTWNVWGRFGRWAERQAGIEETLAVAAPDLDHYEVVWRPTNEDDWTHVISAGKHTSAHVNLSKDNVFFGVRAVDRRGHRSPATFPVPEF